MEARALAAALTSPLPSRSSGGMKLRPSARYKVCLIRRGHELASPPERRAVQGEALVRARVRASVA